MAASDRQLIAKSLAARIHKRAAVLSFDRFGGSSPVFLQQLDKGKKASEQYEEILKRKHFENLVRGLDETLTKKKEEAGYLLSIRNQKKIESAEQIFEKVRELKEDLNFEIQQANISATDEDPTAAEDHGMDAESIRDTIVSWRLDGLPDAVQ